MNFDFSCIFLYFTIACFTFACFCFPKANISPIFCPAMLRNVRAPKLNLQRLQKYPKMERTKKVPIFMVDKKLLFCRQKIDDEI